MFGTGVGVDPVNGSNWALELRTATDTVAVGGISVPKISFFQIVDQTPTFLPDPFDGIMGMGASAQGWFAGAIRQGLPCKRIYLLDDKSASHKKDPQLFSACSLRIRMRGVQS